MRHLTFNIYTLFVSNQRSHSSSSTYKFKSKASALYYCVYNNYPAWHWSHLTVVLGGDVPEHLGAGQVGQ